MKKTLLGVVAFLFAAAPVFAAASHPTWGSFVNDSGVPGGSKLIAAVTYKVVNDEDSGNIGYWALDDYNKQMQVWQTPDQSFYVVARYLGKWQTFAGALSPGFGVVEGRDASGTFQGGYTGTFTAPSCTSVFGNLGSFDFGGTKADVLLGTYGAGQTGVPSPFKFLATYCPGYANFNQNWGWTFHYRGQTWNNFDYGTTGDIVAN